MHAYTVLQSKQHNIWSISIVCVCDGIIRKIAVSFDIIFFVNHLKINVFLIEFHRISQEQHEKQDAFFPLQVDYIQMWLIQSDYNGVAHWNAKTIRCYNV